MRQRRIDSSELISETCRIRIEICCRCPIHVQAAHALHLGMVQYLKCPPPEDPEKCPTPPGITVSRTRRAASSPDSSCAIVQQKSRADPRASLRAVASFSARHCARLFECHDHRIADASLLIRLKYSVTEDLKWAGSLRAENRNQLHRESSLQLWTAIFWSRLSVLIPHRVVLNRRREPTRICEVRYSETLWAALDAPDDRNRLLSRQQAFSCDAVRFQ
jgi:hypothetical protein